MTATEREAIVRNVVTDLVQTLEVFAPQEGDARQLVHGNLKPSNILISSNPASDARYVIADFDTLQVCDSSECSTRITPRYAAPEGLSETSDLWSLGMILLECALGEHPLAHLSDQSARRLIQTIWKPDLSAIESDSVRALLSGLIERNPETRWRGNDLQRWLANDRDLIGEGMARCLESRATEPFPVLNASCFTLRDLVRQLLSGWDAAVLEDRSLRDWIRGPLGRPDVATYLEQLLDDTALTPDFRLLEFCFSLNPAAPPTWRGKAISRESINRAALDVAQDADGGEVLADRAILSLQWLESLLHGQCQNFYNNRLVGIGSMLGKLEMAIERYSSAWDVAIQAGAQNQGRPDRSDLFADAIRASCSIEFRRALERYRDRLAEIPFLVLLDEWARCFGSDLSRLSIPQLLVFRRLNPIARLDRSGVVIDGYISDNEKRRAGKTSEPIIWPATQERLLRMLAPLAGHEVVELQAGDYYHSSLLAPYSWGFERDLRRLLDWLVRIVRRTVSSCRRRILGKTPESVPKDGLVVEEDNPPHLSLRMIRVADPGLAMFDLDTGAELYMGLIRWDTRGRARPYLRIRRAGLLNRETRLLTPRLTERGCYVLLLTGSCRIQLEHGPVVTETLGGVPLWVSKLTRPLVLGLGEYQLKIIENAKNVHTPGGLRSSRGEPRRVLGRITRHQNLSVSTGTLARVDPGFFDRHKPGFWRTALKDAIRRGMQVLENRQASTDKRSQNSSEAPREVVS